MNITLSMIPGSTGFSNSLAPASLPMGQAAPQGFVQRGASPLGQASGLPVQIAILPSGGGMQSQNATQAGMSVLPIVLNGSGIQQQGVSNGQGNGAGMIPVLLLPANGMQNGVQNGTTTLPGNGSGLTWGPNGLQWGNGTTQQTSPEERTLTILERIIKDNGVLDSRKKSNRLAKILESMREMFNGNENGLSNLG